MTKALAVKKASTLPDRTLVGILFYALFILDCRGAATPDQVRIMIELQYLEAPHLRELRVA